MQCCMWIILPAVAARCKLTWLAVDNCISGQVAKVCSMLPLHVTYINSAPHQIRGDSCKFGVQAS